MDFYGNVPLRAFQSFMFGEYAKMVFYGKTERGSWGPRL